jgi:pyruvate/2-oxoglutarate/acetoin dehydrogenase E1 component
MGFILMRGYKAAITEAMIWLAAQERTVFLGQSIAFPGHIMATTLESISSEKLMEMPVFEDTQMGISIGLALSGLAPITIYPRMDFLLLATNQLVNQLDKFPLMSANLSRPKIIIRTMVGGVSPLDPGWQHKGDYGEALSAMMPNVNTVTLKDPNTILDAYRDAYNSNAPTLAIEYGDLYD